MSKSTQWDLPKRQQDALIEALTQDLVLLRAKLGISQAELSKLIGVSRQTYSAVENGYREMSWNTYLALICFYDNNSRTQQMLRSSKAYPTAVFTQFNNGKNPDDTRFNSIAGIPASITEQLDEQAMHAIRTVIMMEYARCTKLSGEAVIKAFDGVDLAPSGRTQEARMIEALSRIQNRDA